MKLLKQLLGNNKSTDNRMIKSFVVVGDVIEVLEYGQNKIYRVENFEVVPNSMGLPTEFVILVKFGYGDNSYVTCTSDKFEYVRHISHYEPSSEKQIYDKFFEWFIPLGFAALMIWILYSIFGW